MAVPRTYSFTRYLAAKKSVDDRALNRHVLETLARSLPILNSKGPLRVLEVGAGIGTMVERLLAWRVLDKAAYTAVDSDPEVIDEARRRLPEWSVSCGYATDLQGPNTMALKKGDQDMLVEFEPREIGEFAYREKGNRSWDLLIASALLDLVDVPSFLPRLFSLLRPGGVFYFTINFDGVTIFQPEFDRTLDAKIVRLYHETMDQRIVSGRPSGDSFAGRHLFTNIQACGAELLDVGSSDWVVYAVSNGYPQDEAYFLHHIIHTIWTALEGSPDLDAELLASWTRERHDQIEQGILVYIAHQLDFLGRIPD
jgi:SAM-dependent methyltransferase